MDHNSGWRLELAASAASAYASNPHVAAALVGGSTARGHADRFSDIELGIFWRRPPRVDEREHAIEQCGGDVHRLFPYDLAEALWEDVFFLGRATPDQSKSGVQVEVSHLLVETVDSTLRSVLEACDPDEGKQNLIAGIVDGLALHNDGLISQWKQRAQRYPDELACAVVNRYAQIDHFWRWDMLVQRSNNLMLLYDMLAQAHKRVLHTLLGLNHVYYFGFKWLDHVEARLPVAPASLAARIARAYQVGPTEGAASVAALVEETYTLVETHLPEIDVERLRRIFRSSRPLWEDMPPFLPKTSAQ